MEKNRYKIILLLLTLLVLFLFGGRFFYSAKYPRVEISRAIPANSPEDQYLETIMVVYGENDIIPISKKYSIYLEELHSWNIESFDQIYANINNGSYHIAVSGEIVDGKTILRYEGYYTSEDGRQTECYMEKSFDFVLDNVLFDNN